MPENPNQRPTWAEINLDNLAFNFHSVKQFIGRNVKIMAVVKADAYGHGAIECARRLESEGVDWFGVALPEEGLELRREGIKTTILCLGSFWPGQEKLILENDLTSVIYQVEMASLLDHASAEMEIVADVHIKIDTGMGRIGVRFDDVNEFAEKLKAFPNLRVEGLMTHLASADDLKENKFTNLQIERFYRSVEIFRSKGFLPDYIDMANSPGAVAHPASRGNMVRLGGVLYGLGGDVLPKEIVKPELRPVFSLHSAIAHIKNPPAGETLGYGRTYKTTRDSIIALVPIGYQDGYSRVLSNKARVIVNGKFAPIVGRISMDWTIINVTDVPETKIGDEVVLIGEKNGMIIEAEELAKLTDTISYEITCGINRRVPRVYRN